MPGVFSRLLLLVPLVAAPSAVAAGGVPPDAQVDAEAERLLVAHVETWVADIAGFNRRHAGCDAAQARTIADYDSAHATTFERTLGWRFDAVTSSWRPGPPEGAEITLTYSGPVRSGTVTIAGKDRSVCRAEAPDKLAVTSEHGPNASFAYHTRTSTVPLPTLPPGVDAAMDAPAPAGTAPPTPEADIAARIARAQAALVAQVGDLDAVAATERKNGTCPSDQVAHWRQFDGSRTTIGTRAAKDVVVHIGGPAYSGPAHEDGREVWLCHVMRPNRVTASALFEQEGRSELRFTTDVPMEPVP